MGVQTQDTLWVVGAALLAAACLWDFYLGLRTGDALDVLLVQRFGGAVHRGGALIPDVGNFPAEPNLTGRRDAAQGRASPFCPLLQTVVCTMNEGRQVQAVEILERGWG